MTTIPHDWKEFLDALRSENVKFLLIGGHALAFHVEARLTEDLDVFVEPGADNAARVARAFSRFGFGDLVSAEELATPDKVFMLGVRPWRIDVLTGIDGVSFEEAWASRVDGCLRVGAAPYARACTLLSVRMRVIDRSIDRLQARVDERRVRRPLVFADDEMHHQHFAELARAGSGGDRIGTKCTVNLVRSIGARRIDTSDRADRRREKLALEVGSTARFGGHLGEHRRGRCDRRQERRLVHGAADRYARVVTNLCA